MLQIVRISEDLPASFDAVLAEARAEGVRNMDRLADEWASGAERFDGPGEALFAAFVDGELAGVGGVSVEAAAPAMRMRRLYVRPAFRRRGVGRALASAMIQQGFEAAALLTANAQASEAAGPFWVAMGFEPSEGPGFTHRLKR